MSTTEALRDGDGNTVTFNFPFEYLEESDVKVTVVGEPTQIQDTHYSFSSLTEITFVTPPPAGTGNVRIFRETDSTSLRSQFFAGSAIRAQDLNENFNQTLYVSQEVNERFIDTNNAVFAADVSLGGFKITNLADGVATTDAVNKSQLDATQNANDAALATAVSNAQAAQTAAETAKTGAETAASTASTSATTAGTNATTASGHADDAAASAAAAAASAGAAANFTGAPVFLGLKRNVANGRTVLRVDYSEGSNTTNTYDPKDYYYKQQYTCQILDNGILHTTGSNLGEPKFAFATTTDASRTSGHVYIQLH